MGQPQKDRKLELYEQYLALPEHLCGEIIGGTLYVMPRPSPPHANATSVLGFELGNPFQRGRGGPGGWWIIDEPELHLAELEPMIPDLAGWRVERMPELPTTAYFSIVPDWVCEVLSDSTRALDRDEKMPRYAASGVKHAWLLDPIAKTLEVRTLGDDNRWRQVRTYVGDVVVRAAPFDAVELELTALWSPPKPAG